MRNHSSKITAAAICCALGSAARADIVYSNNFETNSTANLTTAGTLAGVPFGFVTLPTDSNDLPSLTNSSTWLGESLVNANGAPYNGLGASIGKVGGVSNSEIVNLNLTGLVAGAVYNVQFDLLIGGSWDGSAGGYGPDQWSFAANGTRLIDATFSNVLVGYNGGANSPQTYSDATPLGGLSDVTFAPQAGADASFITTQSNGNYAYDYGIYRFGQGVGNPLLSFVATDTTATLEFARSSGFANGPADSADEYWALDNIVVSGAAGETTTSSVPDASSTTVLLALGLGAIGFARRQSQTVTT